MLALFQVKAHALTGFWWSIRLASGGGESWRGGWGGIEPTRSPVDDVRGGKGTDVASHSLDQLLLQLRAVLNILHEGHVSIDALPFHWMLIPAEYNNNTNNNNNNSNVQTDHGLSMLSSS